jgi:hypothetical protein
VILVTRVIPSVAARLLARANVASGDDVRMLELRSTSAGLATCPPPFDSTVMHQQLCCQ